MTNDVFTATFGTFIELILSKYLEMESESKKKAIEFNSKSENEVRITLGDFVGNVSHDTHSTKAHAEKYIREMLGKGVSIKLQELAASLENPSYDDLKGSGLLGSKAFAKIGTDWIDDVRGHILVNVVRNGIKYHEFHKIKTILPYEAQDWATFLGVTKRTLERYHEENKVFKPQQSEKIVEISQLSNKGLDVFGSRANFNSWLHSKNVALGNVTPISLLDTNIGITMVNDELTRIEHGIFA